MDKIQEIYEGYDDIVQKVGLEKIMQRHLDLYQAYKDFIETEKIVDKVKINSFMLAHAIMDYFTDICRLKEFHKIEATNSYKTIAYEISWLLRRKPLQVLEDGEESLVYINEKFILAYTISFLAQNNIYWSISELKRKSFNGFIESFYYYLKYRNCSAQSLELALLSFEAGVTLNTNI